MDQTSKTKISSYNYYESMLTLWDIASYMLQLLYSAVGIRNPVHVINFY